LFAFAKHVYLRFEMLRYLHKPHTHFPVSEAQNYYILKEIYRDAPSYEGKITGCSQLLETFLRRVVLKRKEFKSDPTTLHISYLTSVIEFTGDEGWFSHLNPSTIPSECKISLHNLHEGIPSLLTSIFIQDKIRYML